MNSDTPTTLRELNALPVGATVLTGGGIAYHRLTTGCWSAPFAKNTPASWLLDPDHSRQPLRVIDTCATCQRPMRPQKASLEKFPGTVKKGTGGECSTCTDRQATRETPVTLCTRCGCPTRAYTLCADCRDTMTATEREQWR